MPASWARWFEERFRGRVRVYIQNDELIGEDPVFALFRIGPLAIEPDNYPGFGGRPYQIFGSLPHLEPRGACQRAMMLWLCAAGAKDHPRGKHGLRRGRRLGDGSERLVVDRSGFAQDSLHTRDWQTAYEFMCDLDPHAQAGNNF